MINHVLQGTAARDLAVLLGVTVLVRGSGARIPTDALVEDCILKGRASDVCLPLSDAARALGERVLKIPSTTTEQHHAVTFLLEIARACQRKGTAGG